MRRRTLCLLALVGFAVPAFAQDVPLPQILSQAQWQPEDARLQRFTAIHTSDGASMLLLTDQGVLAQAGLERGREGQITGIALREIRYLRDPQGDALTGPWRNAQGIAVGGDGRIFVAFEGHDRVWSYAAPDAPAITLPLHPDFSRLTLGAGLSALAISRSGVLHAVPERAARMTYGIPTYHYWNDEWAGSFRLPSDGNFYPVGADIGPDDRLYLLERENGGEGRRVQLRRFVLRGSRIDAGTVVMRSAAGQFGDLSGVSVWQDANGALRALMTSYVSVAGQGSAFVEVALPR